jgi:hypothetical protein
MWSKVSVEQYQSIHLIVKEQSDDVEKIVRVISVLYGLTDQEANRLPLGVFKERAAEACKMFDKPLTGRPHKRIGLRFIDYNVPQIRFGQYVELQHFLKGGVIENLHFIAASITDPIIGKNNSKDHDRIAEGFKSKPSLPVYASVCKFLSHLNDFNKNFSGLFGSTEEDEEDKREPDPFLNTWGWYFSATKIRDHKMVSMDEVMNIPLIEAFNIMVYMKDLKVFEDSQKKKSDNITS